MDSKILKYFKKNHIQIEDIKYLTRVDGKTCIHTMDNQTFLTYITIKDFFESLELHDFICVNKGIVVAKNQINYIADGIYHMLDGAEFQEGNARPLPTKTECDLTPKHCGQHRDSGRYPKPFFDSGQYADCLLCY